MSEVNTGSMKARKGVRAGPYAYAARVAVGLVLVVALAGCSDEDKPGAAGDGDTTVDVRLIPPEATGQNIRRVNGDHLVAIDPSSAGNGLLWLFLPGTGARSNQYSLLANRAAERGFHAINLAYVNNLAVNRVCPGMGVTCHEAMRREIITGEERSTVVQVDSANAVVGRLVSLLEYLAQHFPDEGWDRFLEGGELRWDLIAVAGHSQGGGHAAFMGKLFPMNRVILFSATEPAPWTAVPGRTAPDRYYAFAHALEELFMPISRSWQTLGIPGPVVSVDGVGAPYQGAHLLSTSQTPCRGDPSALGYYHNCHVVDEFTPLLDDGTTPLFADVWDYLMGP